MSVPSSVTEPVDGPQADQRLAQLGLAVALNAGDAEDLAGPHLERQVRAPQCSPRSPGTFRSSTSSTTSAGHGLAPCSPAAATDRPTISAASSASLVAGGRSPDDLAAPDDRDGVGDRLDLLELVRDEDDRPAAVPQLAHDPEQVLGLAGVSTAVGSSRTSTLASRSSALMISTRCCTPTGRSSTSASGSTCRPYRSESSARRGAPAPVEQPRAGRARDRSRPGTAGVPARAPLVAERDVLGDGEDRHEHEVLVHHADAGRDRVPRRADLRPARRRSGSRPRRAGPARRARSSAWSCRRRSRRAGRGSRQAATTRSIWSLATRPPNRLVMPRSSSFTGGPPSRLAPVSCPGVRAGDS